MAAVLMSLLMHDLMLLVFLENLLFASWCCPSLLVGVFLMMLELKHGCFGPCEVTILLCGWHKALSTFQSYVLHF